MTYNDFIDLQDILLQHIKNLGANLGQYQKLYQEQSGKIKVLEQRLEDEKKKESDKDDRLTKKTQEALDKYEELKKENTALIKKGEELAMEQKDISEAIEIISKCDKKIKGGKLKKQISDYLIF